MNTIKQPRFTILTITLMLITVGIFYYVFFADGFYVARELLNPNKIIIETDGQLDKKEVDIYWKTDYTPMEKIMDNGIELDIKYKEYGPNNFTVVYGKDTMGSFNYWKTNNWHGHKHDIFLKKLNDDKIEMKVDIKGPDINK